MVMFTPLLILSFVLVPLNREQLPSPSVADHDFHVSKCLVEYYPGNAILYIRMHLFIDDVETALRRMGQEQLFLCSEREHPEADRYLTDYLLAHLRVEADGSMLQPQFVRKELTDELSGMWCYLEVRQLSHIRQLTVYNDILMETFADQMNIINIIGPNNQTGMFLFKKGESHDSVVFAH